ncbi:MAG: Hvo_1808 family surface protein [Halobacteriota archaeon]
MRRRLGALALAVLLVTAGCVGAPTPQGFEPGGEDPTATGLDPTPTSNPPPDPETDRLGWEDGYWHNETLDVDPSDGLNRSELDAVVARGMARVEAIRGLEFEEPVPVEIIDRATFRNRSLSDSNHSTAQRLHQNVKFEATFFLGEDESAIQQRSANTASSVMGYYAPGNHSITIVSDGGPPLQMNEVTLAQELFHAVQESTFEVSKLSGDTEERHNAKLGIIEGDGNYVDYLYEKRYSEDLIMPDGRSGGGGGSSTHLGMLALRLQPYSDGPVFVESIRQQSGWAGVNAVYDRPPESTEQTIHPERYPDNKPQHVIVRDRSGPDWSVPDQGEGAIDYAQFGEGGLYVMLWYPSHVETTEQNEVTDVVIPYRHFFRTEDSLDMYNYSHPATTGWAGERLVPYVQNDSAATNETGYVWKIAWESRTDAREFQAAYEELLDYHGAGAVEGRSDTYRIDEGKFADAFRVTRSGSTVTIVNAPTVEELDAVHGR